MDAANRNSKRAERLAFGLGAAFRYGGPALLPLVLCQCDYQTAGDHRVTSLRLTLHSPKTTELGSPAAPQQIPSLSFDVEALDERGQVFPASSTLMAFLAAGGSRLSLSNPCAAPPPGGDPPWLLQRFPLVDGRAQNIAIGLGNPGIFGRVELTLEDPQSQALGSTPSIYFPNPTIARLVTPLDPNAGNASYCSPYLGRQVVVDHAAGSGKLVVSSLFQSGIGVSDSDASEYNSLYVFTFGQPPSYLRLGTVISRMSGAIAKFNGMTQLANPALTAADGLRPDLIPPPVELDASRLPDNKAMDQVNNKWLTKHIAAPARLTGVVCEVKNDTGRRDNWLKYNTVVINLVDQDPASTAGCSPGQDFSFRYFSVQMPGKGFAGFDPLIMAGQKGTFTGMLMNSASKSGKTLYWTVAVRSTSDVCLPGSGC